MCAQSAFKYSSFRLLEDSVARQTRRLKTGNWHKPRRSLITSPFYVASNANLGTRGPRHNKQWGDSPAAALHALPRAAGPPRHIVLPDQRQPVLHQLLRKRLRPRRRPQPAAVVLATTSSPSTSPPSALSSGAARPAASTSSRAPLPTWPRRARHWAPPRSPLEPPSAR